MVAKSHKGIAFSVGDKTKTKIKTDANVQNINNLI